jgi:hypothetical protein
LNNLNKIFFAFCLLFSISACSITESKNTFTPLVPKPDTAAVYVYRTLSMSNAFYSPNLYINDAFKLSIKNAQNTRFILEPGKTIFQLAPDESYTDPKQVTLNLVAGKTYYLQVSTQLKIASSTNYQPYRRIFSLQSVTDDVAKEEIAECCTSGFGESIDMPEITTTQPTHEESFSIEKTEDPFSNKPSRK